MVVAGSPDDARRDVACVRKHVLHAFSWLAMPVQWNGLVYSYAVSHLADDLKQHVLSKTNSPLPIQLDFTPEIGNALFELITVSGEYQQFPDGEKPARIRIAFQISRLAISHSSIPEDILVNRLALKVRIRTLRQHESITRLSVQARRLSEFKETTSWH